jgi:hypothetical protein
VTAADRIRARITGLQGIRERYLAYQQDRVNERDHHGAWDVAVNLSETECEISGLEFALKAVEGDRQDKAPADDERPKSPRARFWYDEASDSITFQGFDGQKASWFVEEVVTMLKANGVKL